VAGACSQTITHILSTTNFFFFEHKSDDKELTKTEKRSALPLGSSKNDKLNIIVQGANGRSALPLG
jgi:hypothetical protein